MKSVRILFYGLILGLLLGLAAVIQLLEHDNQFHTYIYDQLQQTFQQQFKGLFSATFHKVHLILPELEFHNVEVYDPDGKWHWKAAKLNINFSWIAFLLKKTIELNICLEGIEVTSALEQNQPAIFYHVQQYIFGETSVPIGLHELDLKNGHFILHDTSGTNRFELPFNGHAAMFGSLFHFNLQGKNGVGINNNQNLFDNCVLDCKMRVNTLQSGSTKLTVGGSLKLCQFTQSNPVCSVRAHWDNGAGQCIVTNDDNSFVCAIYDINMKYHETSAHYQLQAPINYIQKIIQPMFDFKLDGNALIQGSCTIADSFKASGALSLSNMHWHQFMPTHIDVTYENDNDQWQGSVQLSNSDVGSMKGHWFYSDVMGVGQLSCSNDQACIFDQWKSVPHSLLLQCSLAQGVLNGMYYVKAQHIKTDRAVELDGQFIASSEHFKTDGVYNKCRFYIQQASEQGSLVIYDNAAQELINLETKPDGARYKILGFVEYRLVYYLIKEFLGYIMPGKGRFEVHGIYENGLLRTKLEMHDANIRLLNTYNLIKEIIAFLAFDFKTQIITAHDVSVLFDKGSVECKKASVHAHFDGTISYIHAPCILHSLFVNMQKDMFAMLSGNLLFTYKPPEAMLEGSLFIDRAQLKQPIFSQAVQKDLLSSLRLPKKPDQQIALNVSLDTKSPVQIKTSFVQTGAHGKLHVQGTAAQPHITGTVELEEGQLAFPYRPLTITSGKLYFLPNQLDDPLIELIAKGKIRNYHITMRCTGSLQQQHISFESTPPLTEEQIVTLLLAGSEEGSLNLIVPTVVMQRLQDMMFGNDSTPTKVERYIKNIFGPFRFIRFVPKFADQTARGGIRGAIEIDVGDKLRALIQKNFSLTEDTKIEIEYYASDDVTIRAIKDERSDIGGEIEIRWKF